MKLFSYKRKKVADNLYVRVSNHFYYSDFGVRDYEAGIAYGHRYVCSGTPGSGFIERDSESQSYHDFVRRHMCNRRPSYWNMLLEKEPDYNRELLHADTAMRLATDPRKRELLECYTNALSIARHEEEIQRTIDGVKRKMGHRHNKYMVSIISHLKRKAIRLEHDMSAVEYQVKDHYTPETYEAYGAMIDAFCKMSARCRRIWHHGRGRAGRFMQVFFDIGVFDFIRNEKYLPLMRDSEGVSYYILPDSIIVARSSTDFDLVPLKTLTVVYQDTSISETTEMLSGAIGEAACMLLIPELNLTFYFNHAHVVVDFVKSIDQLKQTL